MRLKRAPSILMRFLFRGRVFFYGFAKLSIFPLRKYPLSLENTYLKYILLFGAFFVEMIRNNLRKGTLGFKILQKNVLLDLCILWNH